jgi:hypothetical protein
MQPSQERFSPTQQPYRTYALCHTLAASMRRLAYAASYSLSAPITMRCLPPLCAGWPMSASDSLSAPITRRCLNARVP